MKEGVSRNRTISTRNESTTSTAGEFYKGVALSAGAHGLELYLKTREILHLYARTQLVRCDQVHPVQEACQAVLPQSKTNIQRTIRGSVIKGRFDEN